VRPRSGHYVSLVDRGLAGGVGSAGDEEVLAGEGGGFGCGRAVEDASAGQGVQAGGVEPAVGHACGDQDAAGEAYLAAEGAVRGGLEPGDRPGHGRMAPKDHPASTPGSEACLLLRRAALSLAGTARAADVSGAAPAAPCT